LAGDIALRSPLATLDYTVSLLARPTFWPHLQESAKAFGAALAIAIAMGLAIGLVLGFNRLAGDVMEPMFVALYSIPKVTLYPILLLSFGLGMSAKVAFGAIHGIIPIALFTINAVRNVKPILIKTARVMKLNSLEMATRVLLPAALPEIFTGIRIGFSLTLIGTLLGEMFASQRGLGYMLMNAIGLHNVDIIMAVTFLLIVFAALVSSILLRIDHALHRRF
jgi:NitT/TauT family transport system permease protein